MTASDFSQCRIPRARPQHAKRPRSVRAPIGSGFPYHLPAAGRHRGATPPRGQAPTVETGCLGDVGSRTIALANLNKIAPAETAGRWSNNGGGNGGQKLADRGPVHRVLQLRPRLSV